MPRPFAHLQLHTQYSLLDGAIQHKALFARARALGMPAVWLPKASVVAVSPTAGTGAAAPGPLRLTTLVFGVAL